MDEPKSSKRKRKPYKTNSAKKARTQKDLQRRIYIPVTLSESLERIRRGLGETSTVKDALKVVIESYDKRFGDDSATDSAGPSKLQSTPHPRPATFLIDQSNVEPVSSDATASALNSDSASALLSEGEMTFTALAQPLPASDTDSDMPQVLPFDKESEKSDDDDTVIYTVSPENLSRAVDETLNQTTVVMDERSLGWTYIDDTEGDPDWNASASTGAATAAYDEADDEDMEDDDDDEDDDCIFITCPKGMTQEEIMDLPVMPVDDEEGEDDLLSADTDDPLIDMTFNPEEIVSKSMCLVYNEALIDLANMAAKAKTCQTGYCRRKIEARPKTVGSALVIKWVCKDGHPNGFWESQKRLSTKGQGVYAGDFMLATNILLSGNNYQKVALLFKFMNIPCVSKRFFTQVQGHYCVPEINKFFNAEMDRVHSTLKDDPIVVAGDARNDSPGRCAQFSTYTFMNVETQDIVCMNTTDKRQTGRSSYAMEKAGFVKGLDDLEKAGVTVGEVVTDAHPQISALMREKKNIVHQQDIWHSAKNRSKKLAKITLKAANKALRVWQPDIINHFWHCCEYASTVQGSDNKKAARMKSRWKGMLHHVIDKHHWATDKCQHEPDLEETKPYLDKSSDAYKALEDFVCDKTLLKNFNYYVRFRHTGQLEVFHSMLLMYASKRFAFSPPVYEARVQLAALDYQNHKDRNYAFTQDGKAQYRRTFNKKSGVFSVVAVKETKTYPYIGELQSNILTARHQDKKGLHRKLERAPSDPRNLGLLAAPEAPPTSELVAKQKTRMGKTLPKDKE